MKSGQRFTGIMLALFSGCAPNPSTTTEFAVVAEIRDDEGTPVPGASVGWSQTDTSITDGNGRATRHLRSREGDRIRVTASCPEGMLPEPPQSLTLVLKSLRTTTADAGTALTAAFTCRPARRTHVLVVRAEGRRDLKIRMGGAVVATTDADGAAQFTVEGDAGDRVEVVIDTSEFRRLKPQMPARRFTLPATRRFLVFDQKFTERRPAPRKRKPEAIRGPVRL